MQLQPLVRPDTALQCSGQIHKTAIALSAELRELQLGSRTTTLRYVLPPHSVQSMAIARLYKLLILPEPLAATD